MKTPVAWSMAVAGAAGTVLATVGLPWAQYGDIEIMLNRFPGWGWYVLAAIALHLCIGWALVANRGRRPLVLAVCLALAVATAGSAVALMLRYDDPSAVLFDSIVPAVAPVLGAGGPVAVAAAVISTSALAIADRRRT